jgi:hypothetical protein
MKKLLLLIVVFSAVSCGNLNPVKELDCSVSQSYGYNKSKKGENDLKGFFLNTKTGEVLEKDDTTNKLKILNGETTDDLIKYETKSGIKENMWKMEMILTDRFKVADSNSPYKFKAELNLKNLYYKKASFTYEGFWRELNVSDGYCKLIPTSLKIEKSTH